MVLDDRSSGSGKLLKSGGKTRGFFLITKNSSLDSYFFPDKASLTDWHEYNEIIKINKSIFLNIIFTLKKKFIKNKANNSNRNKYISGIKNKPV